LITAPIPSSYASRLTSGNSIAGLQKHCTAFCVSSPGTEDPQVLHRTPLPPPKKNRHPPENERIDTKNDGTWKMYLLSNITIFGSYVRFQGCIVRIRIKRLMPGIFYVWKTVKSSFCFLGGTQLDF